MRRRNRGRRERKHKIEFQPKYVFAVLAVLCLTLIFLSFRFKEQFAPIKSAVVNTITPMQRGINSFGEIVSGGIERFSRVDRLLEENEELKNRIEELSAQNQVLTQEKYELNWFRDLYQLDMKYTEYSKVAAKVISREPNSYCNEFIIDKGTDDGLAVNMNVISGNGLVGIITDVGKNWSRVRSVIDDSSRVSGMFLKTSDTCIVSGNLELLDDGYIDVSMIDNDAEIFDHYEVVTSYISDRYLPGILIGYVTNIRTDSSTMAQEAYLIPAVDFEHIEAVLVITQLREQLENLNEVISGDN